MNWLILKIIGQSEVNNIMTLLIKTITSVVKILTYIITSISACPNRLTTIPVIMSVSTFSTADILDAFLKVVLQHTPTLILYI
jgi:hypothetical protein